MLFLELRKKSSKRRGYRKMRPPKPKRLAMSAKQAAAAQEEADAAAAAESSSVAFNKPITRREEEDKDEQEPDLPTNKEYKYIDDDDDGEHQDRVSKQAPTISISEEVEEGSSLPALPRSSSPTQAQSEETVNLPSVPLPPVQPTGEFYIIIYRLSSGKPIKVGPENTMTFAKRVTANCDRRKAEGYILADRLAANCPSPMTFTRV
ncbi:hypothetical protein COCVIDRAFT_16651 [Bipolaris victoriae FI3]|uniref:Uncharacterized protein n=1 Tax=Bipolaris victoriae (strain FI3) TaxID=930091 RepID=W7EKB8_BIPV3|nr:hypothetical protein COCVIDRAFT_16651 [Bipolaris victoriae FI3]